MDNTSLLVLIALLGVGVLSGVYALFRRQRKEKLDSLAAMSQIIQTAKGPIEIATAGDGPPVLMVHGAGGGFDRGLTAFVPQCLNPPIDLRQALIGANRDLAILVQKRLFQVGHRRLAHVDQLLPCCLTPLILLVA